MLIVYDSRSGKGANFAQKVSNTTQSIADSFQEKAILVTRNEGRGQISQLTKAFLDENKDKIVGVVVNGNMERHAETFCGAADLINEEYGLPIVARIDGEGTPEDVAVCKAFIESL